MTKTEQLAEKIKEIAFAHKDKIEELSTTDERGGKNAALIPGWMDGWMCVGKGTITKACKLAGVPTMIWQDSSPDYFPVAAFPECVFIEAMQAYNEAFHSRRNDPKKMASLIIDNLEYDKDWDR